MVKRYNKKFKSWGGRELSAIINGKLCGVKFDNGKAQTYYYRHPQLSGSAKKVNLGGVYKERGPQPLRLKREEAEKEASKPIDYQSLSDEEKWAEHEKSMIKGDILKGWRCVICKEMFIEDDDNDKADTGDDTGNHGEKRDIVYQIDGKDTVLYYHHCCNK